MKPYCFTIENDECEEITHHLPSCWEICDHCGGNGTRDNPAFSNGLSQEDFEEDPDFREDYMSGRYDVRCDDCDGAGKVLVPDEDRCTPEQKSALDQHYRNLEHIQREHRADNHTRWAEGGYQQ